VDMQLFSLDYGVYGALYEHTNLSEILGSIKTGYTANYNEDKTVSSFLFIIYYLLFIIYYLLFIFIAYIFNVKKVILHLGPGGVLPIELDQYPTQTPENKVQMLEEEVRRLNAAQIETKKELYTLKERMLLLEKQLSLSSKPQV
jgi:hypothetical protein